MYSDIRNDSGSYCNDVSRKVPVLKFLITIPGIRLTILQRRSPPAEHLVSYILYPTRACLWRRIESSVTMTGKLSDYRKFFQNHILISKTALYTLTQPHPIYAPSGSTSAPTAWPPQVYRVHRTSSQTRYSFSTGFSSKNQTTIVNYTSALSRFGLAHLNQQTNISSPFISVYDNLAHAEAVAKHLGERYGEDTWVVTVDPAHFARGPVFRAMDILKDSAGGKDANAEWLHYGEYLVMYRIPPQAIRDETPVCRGADQRWRAVGVIGGSK